MKKVILRCNGGLGKQIMATRVAKQIKLKYPDCLLHVQTSYPEVFANLPFVDRYFPYQPIPYFYNDHIDFEILETEIYADLKYRQGKEQAIETWCRKLGLGKPEEISGILELDENEKAAGHQFIMQNKIDVSKLVAIQPFGGTSYYQPNDARNVLRVKQQRDLKVETAQKIVTKLKEEGFDVVQISLPTEPILQGAILPSNTDVANPRFIFSILNQCKYGIFIDSSAQHAWKALGKKDAIVLWGATNPKSLGYDSNINIEKTGSCNSLHCNRPNTHVGDFTGNNNVWKCLYNGKCMDFDGNEIADKVVQLHNDSKNETPMPTNIEKAKVKKKK